MFSECCPVWLWLAPHRCLPAMVQIIPLTHSLETPATGITNVCPSGIYFGKKFMVFCYVYRLGCILLLFKFSFLICFGLKKSQWYSFISVLWWKVILYQKLFMYLSRRPKEARYSLPAASLQESYIRLFFSNLITCFCFA